MKDFLLFRKMLSPIFIQIIFWVAVVFFIYTAIRDIMQHNWLFALASLILGPLLARIACEMLIVFFRINGNLHEIRKKLSR